MSAPPDLPPLLQSGQATPALGSSVGRPQGAGAIIDDAEREALRRHAVDLDDGTDWSRVDDHEVIAQLAAALSDGRLRLAVDAPPPLLPLVQAQAPAPPASAPPAAPPPARAAASTPVPTPAPDSTFEPDLDVAAMVAALQDAAQEGVPFCEECAKAAARRVVAEAAA